MKKLLTALVIIVSMATAGSVCAQGYQKWTVLAEQRNAGAQFNLGVIYSTGQGVVQDDIIRTTFGYGNSRRRQARMAREEKARIARIARIAREKEDGMGHEMW